MIKYLPQCRKTAGNIQDRNAQGPFLLYHEGHVNVTFYDKTAKNADMTEDADGAFDKEM
jgi:hypothetical protein